ncbi:MAG: hypothetical protein II517_00175, partial [Ruminococcus sp.]|nr:hypothetical protein [Ruminococcus sp.]
MERRLCIFTQLNGASKRGSTVCSKKYSHFPSSQPNAKRTFGKTAVYFNPTEWRVKTRTVIDLKPTQPFSPHNQASNALSERRLYIFTQLNGVSKQGKTATSNQHSHS